MSGTGARAYDTKRAATVEWLTPPWILAALGEFDLDPCAIREPRPWPTARVMWTERGLERDWSGRVWLNPPYGAELVVWLERLALHGNGVALVFARTETVAFQRHVWPVAHAVHFIRERLTFHRPDGTRATGSAGAPSVLIAYGPDNADALARSGIPGFTVRLK